VQRSLTKRFESISNLSYDERLQKLENEGSELRRLQADLLMCYKILHHFVVQNSIELGLDAGTVLFLLRIIIVWNRLSDEIVNASSISSFYYKLVKIDLFFAIIGKH